MDNKITERVHTPLKKELKEDFTNWLTRLGYHPSTIKAAGRKLHYFFTQLKTNEVETLEAIEPKHITDYQNHLDQQPLKGTTIRSYLGVLRLFDEFLEKYEYSPIITTTLKNFPDLVVPRTILTQQEVQQLYEATDQSAFGYLDRAMLALYYGCGLRAGEGISIKIEDINYQSGLLQVRKSKTYKQRYVPMNEKVMADLKDWIEYGRKIILHTECDYILVHKKGNYKTGSSLNQKLKKLLEKSGIDKPVTLHGLRHSIGTHLMEKGLEMEYIRQFLGHSSLETTQRYTHFMYEQL